MEVIFHFVFQLFKISCLSAAYAGLVVLGLRFVKVGRLGVIEWFGLGALIWIGLFVYSFTYWGNHGLGDTYRIPLGNSKVLESINAMEYADLLDVMNSSGQRVEMSKFAFTEEVLVGNCDDWFYDVPCSFFAYEIASENLLEFPDSSSYMTSALKHGWPTLEEHGTYEQNYRKHWSGWRYWLLP